MEYTLRGFGADKFKVNSDTGEISVNDCQALEQVCLDYETQKSFALTYTGTDGGGQITTTSVRINIQDVNDNYPRFEVSNAKFFLETMFFVIIFTIPNVSIQI